ncbi:hypothetical protein [Flavobacterium sp.]|uniref:hypothetical protein n=1 Tax=Flavobacterium sp. TaxID=239 RepID=UPI002628CACD|nr:hypothetical protein [Flavobacterium sp.]
MKKAIEEFDLVKFRKIQNFILKDGTTSKNSLNLVAILVDFNPRPFAEFIKLEQYDYELQKVEGIKTIVHNPQKIDYNEVPKYDKYGELTNEASKPEIAKRFRKWSKGPVFISFLLLAIFSVFISKTYLSDSNKCLQWQTDRYAIIRCDENMELGRNGIEAYSEALLQFRKVTPDSTTEPFRNGKPALWTARGESGSIEFFNGPGTGKHPVTYFQLKPITHGLAKKLVDDHYKE